MEKEEKEKHRLHSLNSHAKINLKNLCESLDNGEWKKFSMNFNLKLILKEKIGAYHSPAGLVEVWNRRSP